MEVTYTFGGQLDWTLLAGLAGVVVGFSLTEFAASRRRRRQEAITLRHMSHEIRLAYARATLVAGSAASPKPVGLLVATIDVLHDDVFAAVASVLAPNEGRALGGILAQYEFDVESQQLPNTNALEVTIGLLETREALLRVPLIRIGRRRQLNEQLQQWHIALDGIYPGWRELS